MRSDSDDFEEGAEDEMSEYDQELSSEESLKMEIRGKQTLKSKKVNLEDSSEDDRNQLLLQKLEKAKGQDDSDAEDEIDAALARIKKADMSDSEDDEAGQVRKNREEDEGEKAEAVQT